VADDLRKTGFGGYGSLRSQGRPWDFLWDSYNFPDLPASKTYAHGGTSAPANAIAVPSVRASRRRGASHVGYRHAGARPQLLRGGHRLRLCLRTAV